MIMGAASGGAVTQVAQRFGLDPNQAQAAISALLPALTGGLQNAASNPSAMQAIMGALSNGDHQQYADDPSALANQQATDDGNTILGHLLGSKEASRAAAAQAAQETGLDHGMLKQMLPIVASLAMGALSKHAASSGAAAQVQQGGGGGDLMSMIGGLLGGGGQQGGGNDLMGSVLKMAAGSLFGGKP